MNSETVHSCIRQTKAFMSRMFYRALCDYVNYKHRWGGNEKPQTKRDKEQKENFDSARQWFRDSSPDEEWILSFESVCNTLEWDPEWVRREIDQLKPADLRRVQKKCGLV